MYSISPSVTSLLNQGILFMWKVTEETRVVLSITSARHMSPNSSYPLLSSIIPTCVSYSITV